MNIPSDLRYSQEHEWVRVEGDVAVVGITDFAQSQLGDIVYVDITTLGDKVAQGGVFGAVEAVKTVSDLFMPVAGVVQEFNPEVDADPELVNKDPYGRGWLVKVKMDDASQVDSLLGADDYLKIIG